MISKTEANRARRNFTQHPSARVGCLVVWSLLAAGAVSALYPAEKKNETASVTVPVRAQAPAPTEPRPDIEAHFFTAPGFSRPGRPVTAAAADNGKLRLIVRDASTGQPTPCRINVVGADGNFYQPPASDRLAEWSLANRANRKDLGPYRYLGYFFYSSGETTLDVPPGPARIEVWKGLEFSPAIEAATMEAGTTREVTMTLRRAAPMADLGYYSADLHIHLPRRNDDDDALAFDLMEAEDISYAASLASNSSGAYAGILEKLVGGTPPMRWPQMQGFGPGSVRERGARRLMTGQEYRSGNFGHLNLYWRDTVVLPGASYNTNGWPAYGLVGRETQQQGGFAIYAHGGYHLGIYADATLGAIDAVEVLQFGIYRGIGLRDWYNILNSGYRLPGFGASDYPACRKLADCVTYAQPRGATGGILRQPTMKEWLQASVEGRSFVTSGPLLLLEVNGEPPGAVLKSRSAPSLIAKIRVRSEVAPVTHVDLIVNGHTLRRFYVPAERTQGAWHEFEHAFKPGASCWIAARAWSQADFGIKLPYDDYGDSAADAHTNPVYCTIDGKAPYSQASLDAWISRLDARIDTHRRSEFAEKDQVIAYYGRARTVLTKIRAEGGLSDTADVRLLGGELPTPTPGSSGGSPRPMPIGIDRID